MSPYTKQPISPNDISNLCITGGEGYPDIKCKEFAKSYNEMLNNTKITNKKFIVDQCAFIPDGHPPITEKKWKGLDLPYQLYDIINKKNKGVEHTINSEKYVCYDLSQNNPKCPKSIPDSTMNTCFRWDKNKQNESQEDSNTKNIDNALLVKQLEDQNFWIYNDKITFFIFITIILTIILFSLDLMINKSNSGIAAFKAGGFLICSTLFSFIMKFFIDPSPNYQPPQIVQSDTSYNNINMDIDMDMVAPQTLLELRNIANGLGSDFKNIYTGTNTIFEQNKNFFNVFDTMGDLFNKSFQQGQTISST